MFFLLLVLVSIGVFATELISNTAVTAKLAPFLMGVALQLGLETDSLVVPVAIATSMAFICANKFSNVLRFPLSSPIKPTLV